MSPSITVIVSTYNQPDHLRRVFAGYSCQSATNFDMIIADDGSSDETRGLIDRMMPQVDFPVLHLWQRDDGFRKCRILNKAITAAQGDYLILTDGDCVPEPDLVARHGLLARKGRFLSVGAIRLPEQTTDAMTADDIHAGRIWNYPWLVEQGLPDRWKYRRFFLSPELRRGMDAVLPIKPTFNGNGSSCWREDARAVNGFDERLGYGGEDVEFGQRLIRHGVQPLMARHRIRALHLDHARGYVDDEAVAENKRLIAACNGRSWAEAGIRKRDRST